MITVIRKTYTDRSITGMLDIDGIFQCYTLEPPLPAGDNPQKPYAIPAGTYTLQKYNSPRLGRTVLLLQGVPGFENIEIHNGNYPRNTHGCTLVGQTCGPDFVGNSIAALDSLLAKLPDNSEITYIDTLPQSESQPEAA